MIRMTMYVDGLARIGSTEEQDMFDGNVARLIFKWIGKKHVTSLTGVLFVKTVTGVHSFSFFSPF